MQLRAEIEVAASPDVVWRVLTDTKRLHEWNPFITRLDGSLTEGSSVQIHFVLPEGSDRRLRAQVLTAKPGEELRLVGSLGPRWFLRGEHFAELVPVVDGRTRVVHGQNFEGLLLRLAPNTMTRSARALTLLNAALKRRVESLPAKDHAAYAAP